jgi:hypothetical protein
MAGRNPGISGEIRVVISPKSDGKEADMSSFPGLSNLEAQATVARAFKYANLLLNFATVTMLLFWASLAPFIGSAVRVGHLVSVIVFPFLVLMWFSEYYWGLQEGIDKNHEKLIEARKRIKKEALWVWGISIVLILAREIVAYL